MFISALALSCSLAAKADIHYVSVSYFSGLSPDPISVSVNDVVYWLDDDWGPYLITFPGWGSFETPNGVQFLSAGTYYYDDGVGDYGTVIVGTPNTPPFIDIIHPLDKAVLTAPATFAFQADAYDINPGDMAGVEFWVGPDMLEFDNTDPFGIMVTNLAAGEYTLMAVAYDYSGATTPDTIQITVVEYTGPISLGNPVLENGKFRFVADGLVPGRSTILQTSPSLGSATNWTSVATNVAAAATQSFTNAVSAGARFFRVIQNQ